MISVRWVLSIILLASISVHAGEQQVNKSVFKSLSRAENAWLKKLSEGISDWKRARLKKEDTSQAIKQLRNLFKSDAAQSLKARGMKIRFDVEALSDHEMDAELADLLQVGRRSMRVTRDTVRQFGSVCKVVYGLCTGDPGTADLEDIRPPRIEAPMPFGPVAGAGGGRS